MYEAYLPGASVGSLCDVIADPLIGESSDRVEAEVVGFRDKRVLLMPFEQLAGINPGSLVVLKKRSSSYRVRSGLLGRVIDARGEPIDGKGPIADTGPSEDRNLYAIPLDPLDRGMISDSLDLGVRSINGLITCGRGQRVGIMAGSGVGKSVLMGMTARNTSADINVIALVGERGREVREFIERDLGPEGLARSVVIVATSDTAPLLRVRAAFLATTVAEYYRDQGKQVLLLMDSLTRFCMAQREMGLSLGEPPASKGYTPSVFALMPKLLERAGLDSRGGSVTGLYTVLVEGDDLNDPVADAARAILDGHIVLSRRLAERGHFPAVDILQSVSRVMSAVATKEHLKAAQQVREWLSVYEQARDLIEIGAYVKGTNPKLDQAVVVYDRMIQFLRQGAQERGTLPETIAYLSALTSAGTSQPS